MFANCVWNPLERGSARFIGHVAVSLGKAAFLLEAFCVADEAAEREAFMVPASYTYQIRILL
jgi:hypothetical protein